MPTLSAGVVRCALACHPRTVAYKNAIWASPTAQRWFGTTSKILNRPSSAVATPGASPFRLAVIGSGPAGFYTAHKVLKDVPNALVDMYEALPVPYGLVRFGVAPDHPEVKNVINKFDEVAQDPRFTFIGNVTVGRDFTLSDLKPHYSAVLLAYGASEDRRLDIPGEDARGVFSARAFVGWYNGLPLHRNLEPDLTTTDTAVVIGQGNVALDVARILLTPLDVLRKTDITEFALEALSKSMVRHVRVVGRRGPLQAAFTAKELREMMALPDTAFRTDSALLQHELTASSTFLGQNRPIKRLMSILEKGSTVPPGAASKSWSLDFLRSPVEILANGEADSGVQGVRFELNRLEGPAESARAVRTGEFENVQCGLVLRSIGYRSVGLEDVPFDQSTGRVPNLFGKIIAGNEELPGMYTSGWLKRGPTGVIAATMSDAYETAETIVADLQAGKPMLGGASAQEGAGVVLPLLRERGTRPTTYLDWKAIERAELESGVRLGKPREKFGRVEEMMSVLAVGRE